MNCFSNNLFSDYEINNRTRQNYYFSKYFVFIYSSAYIIIIKKTFPQFFDNTLNITINMHINNCGGNVANLLAFDPDISWIFNALTSFTPVGNQLPHSSVSRCPLQGSLRYSIFYTHNIIREPQSHCACIKTVDLSCTL